MGTFDQKIVDEINEQIEESKKLHCPRCFSTNVETDGGYEYGSNGVGASGYGWDSGDGLVTSAKIAVTNGNVNPFTSIQYTKALLRLFLF